MNKLKLKERIFAWTERMRARQVAFKRGRMARVTSEGIGFALAVVGGIIAVAGLLGVIFVPSASFPLIDVELTALLGIVLLVIGAAIGLAEK